MLPTQKAARLPRKGARIIINRTVIIALLLRVGNRIPKIYQLFHFKGVFCVSKKLLPPRWDEKHQRWQKDYRFSGFRKNFYSKCKSEKTATKDIALQIENWKDSLDGLSMYGKMSPMSTVENIYHKGFKQDLEERTSQRNWRPAENRIEHHVLPFIGKMRIMDLNDGILQRVISKAYQAGLSKKTIRSIKGDMTSLVKYCRKLKLTKYRPEDIDIPVSAPKSEKSILQPSDLQILFSVDTSRINGQIEIEPYVYGYRLQVLHGL